MRNSFKGGNKGTAAVEFALIAPILCLFLFAIIEISVVMVANGILESAVRQAARAGLTGYTPVGLTRDAYILQQVKANLIFLDQTKLTMTNKVYQDFPNIGQPEPFTDSNGNGIYNLGEPFTDMNGNGQWDSDMGASGAGAAGAVVVYKVTYPWKIVTPMLSKFFSSTGDFNISASMVVRNEPFD